MAKFQPVSPVEVSARCQQLAQNVYSRCLALKPEQRVIIGIAGIPGAGKSTISDLVVQHLNKIHRSATINGANELSPDIAIVVPMDGFHLTRAQLKQLAQPDIAIHRRGAAFTYNAEAFLAFINSLRQPITLGTRTPAPSFNHATKDPVEGDIQVLHTNRIVIIEGNYCALNRKPWSTAAGLMDELWFVHIDREVARGRLALRHVESGITPNLESALERIRSTDFINADDIMENLLEIQEVIET